MIKYSKQTYKYTLEEGYQLRIPIYPPEDIYHPYIILSKDGLLTIKMGYKLDGPSGPTIDTKSSLRAALVHDALYQLMREKLLDFSWRYKADDLLRDIAIEDGMFKIRAYTWHFMVGKFAIYAAKPQEKIIYTAP